MNKPKTLVILTPGFPADESDTTCLPSQQVFVKALKENNPSLNIIVLAFQYPFLRSIYQWHGVSIISFNGANKGKLRRIRVWLDVWRTLSQLKRQNNIIGILNFWLTECALIGKYFGKLNRIKQYTWLLGQDAKKGNKYFSLVKPHGSQLIALSDFIAEEFFKNYNIKPQYIIPVGIDISMFDDEQVERAIDVMGAGSLIPLKQYDVFIDIIKKLSFHFPKIHVIICGKGNEKEKLKTLIHDLSLTNNITLMDEVPHPEVIRLMQRTKVFLHTSLYEGFGAVNAEALYAGCHVISFVKPMNEEIEHWHIVNSQDKMIKKAFEILSEPGIKYNPVLFYSAANAAVSIMNLFGY